MGCMNLKKEARIKRKRRIRKKVFGTGQRPRLSVFRSSRHIYAQIIDDTNGVTVAAASTVEPSVREMKTFGNKIEKAAYIGKLVAERAIQKGVKQVVFDRSGFIYHGRVKAVSEGARENGLDF